MIDIHSHILFGVDDGAKTIEESIVHIKKAISLGYKGIVCSTHYKLSKFENDNYNKNFKILEKEVLDKELPITIYKGNELELKEGVLEKISKINTINNSKYILIEFSDPLIFKAYKKMINEIIQKGYIPVLAHVERYPYIKFSEFMELYDENVIFQMNLSTVSKMSKKIKFMLENGYINVVATDAHRVGDRDYNVLRYLKKLKKIVGEERYSDLTYENPKKIIENKKIKLKPRREKKNEKGLSFNGIINFVFTRLWNGINCGRCNSKG